MPQHGLQPDGGTFHPAADQVVPPQAELAPLVGDQVVRDQAQHRDPADALVPGRLLRTPGTSRPAASAPAAPRPGRTAARHDATAACSPVRPSRSPRPGPGHRTGHAKRARRASALRGPWPRTPPARRGREGRTRAWRKDRPAAVPWPAAALPAPGLPAARRCPRHRTGSPRPGRAGRRDPPASGCPAGPAGRPGPGQPGRVPGRGRGTAGPRPGGTTTPVPSGRTARAARAAANWPAATPV